MLVEISGFLELNLLKGPCALRITTDHHELPDINTLVYSVSCFVPLTCLLPFITLRYLSVPELSGHCLDSSPNGPLSRGLLTSQIECRLDLEDDFQTRQYPLPG